MKRQPSIHISEQNLVKVLEELDIDSSSYDAKGLAKAILQRGKHYNMTNRVVLASTDKIKRRAGKLVMSEREDAEQFAKLLNLIRKQRKHRGINIIKVGSRDWGMIKELTSLAISFANDFELEKKPGFKAYINIALGKMKKFSLMKFNNLHQGICAHYEAELRIRDDETPKLTDLACKEYMGILLDKNGINLDYKEMPEKYVFFIEAKEQAVSSEVPVDIYIKAQFFALEWANAIPDPSQLVGVKATERVNKYLTEKNIKLDKKSQSTMNFDKIRNT